MLLNLTTYSSRPFYDQIIEQILNRVIEAEIKPGDEIISIGKLSRQQHVNKTTVGKAYQHLERMGILEKVRDERFIVNSISREKLENLRSKQNGIPNKSIEKRKFETEIEAARQIQRGLLPTTLPDNNLISSSVYSTVPEVVGGDFYDVFEIHSNQYGILIGDASGNGLAAAMLISQIQAIIKSDIEHKRTIKQTLELLNTFLKQNSLPKNFATLFYGVLNIQTGEIVYGNAGHNFPMIIKKHGGIEQLKTTGPALGLMDKIEFEEKQSLMNPGDLLILFTDGLTEAINTSQEMFSEVRLEKICGQNKTNSAVQIIETVKSEFFKFISSAKDGDDVTVLAIKMNESENKNLKEQ